MVRKCAALCCLGIRDSTGASRILFDFVYIRLGFQQWCGGKGAKRRFPRGKWEVFAWYTLIFKFWRNATRNRILQTDSSKYSVWSGYTCSISVTVMSSELLFADVFSGIQSCEWSVIIGSSIRNSWDIAERTCSETYIARCWRVLTRARKLPTWMAQWRSFLVSDTGWPFRANILAVDEVYL